MFESGLFTIGRWRGVPIRIHWTALLGAFVFGGFRFAPGAWIGFFLIVVLHELGHAWLVRRRGLHAVAVHVHMLGGECRYAGPATPLDRAIIAWGGVLAQAVVLALAFAVLVPLLGGTEGGPVPGSFAGDLVRVLTVVNAIIIGINLLPFRPLDGHEAWKLPGLLKRKKGGRGRGGTRAARPRRKAKRKTPPPDPERASQDASRLTREALEEARRRNGGGTN